MATRQAATATRSDKQSRGLISGGVQDQRQAGGGLVPLRKIAKSVNPEVPPENIQRGGPLQIVYRPLAALVPYERNARTHSKRQIEKIKRSLIRYGWTTPIAMAENTIIAGHARTQAATQLQQEGISIRGNPDAAYAPTIDLSHLSADDRRAYIIADNKLAEEAGWDLDLLKLEFVDMSMKGIDLTITGFDMSIASKIMSREPDVERVLNEQEADAMDRAWLRAITEWLAIVAKTESDYITTSYTKGVLAVQFLRSLFYRDEFPRGATLAYTPHRHSTNGDKGSIIDAMRAALGPEGRSVRNSIRWASAERPSLDKLIGAMTLPIHGMRLPGDFPADLAADLIDEFTKPGARVLDPCHGWGGRMVGYMLSEHAISYLGYDPSDATHHGVCALYDDLCALVPWLKKSARMVCAPFEDAKLKPSAFDFALTSPPYFDTEKYDGAASSWRKYATYAEWRDGFYAPLIQKVSLALKPGAVFCLQVGSQQYPLKEDAIALAPRFNFSHDDTRHTAMINNRTGTDPDDGEVVIVLRRQR